MDRRIALLACGLFVVYAIISIRLHQLYRSTAFDLGVNEQVVRSWAGGRLPTVELIGPNRSYFGVHFSPALALIAPFYRLFRTPITLLVVQAALLAVSAIPVARTAQRRLGRPTALTIGLVYGLSWGLADLVGFDFHEVALAVPLMAFSVAALLDQRYRAAVAWALPMLFVKEDLGLTIAAMGAFIAWRGARRLGAITAATGLIGTGLAIVVLVHNVPGGTLSAWLKTRNNGVKGRPGLSGFVQDYTFGLFQPDVKVSLLAMLLVPTALLALRSPIVALCLPTMAWRLSSADPNHWQTRFQYSAVLMPILFIAFIDALERTPTPVVARRVREPVLISVVVTAILLPSHGFWTLVTPSTWRSHPTVSDARTILGMIPDHARVAASDRLVPHLVSRDQVTYLGMSAERHNPEWIVVDMTDPGPFFDNLALRNELVNDALTLGYQLRAKVGHFQLLHRDPTSTAQFPPRAFTKAHPTLL